MVLVKSLSLLWETCFCWQCLWTVILVSVDSACEQWDLFLLTVLVNSETCFCWQCLWTVRLVSVDSACEQWDLFLLTVLVNSETCFCWQCLWTVRLVSVDSACEQWDLFLLTVLVNSETCFCWQCLWTVKTAVSTSSCINQLSRYLLSRRHHENFFSSSPVSEVWMFIKSLRFYLLTICRYHGVLSSISFNSFIIREVIY